MQINKRLIKKEEKYKLLWENPNPTQAIQPDTLINLSSDDYDYLEIFWGRAANQPFKYSTTVLKGQSTSLDCVSTGNTGLWVRNRNMDYINNTRYKLSGGNLQFSTSGNSITTENTACIPLYIYGGKFND